MSVTHKVKDKFLTEDELDSLYEICLYKGLTFIVSKTLINKMHELYVLQEVTKQHSYWKYIGTAYSIVNGEMALHSFVNLDIGDSKKVIDRIKEELNSPQFTF